MLITKVELKNIKNHAEAEFTFQPGIIAVCGPNGAGKTTILEAIAWALFDHLDYKRDDFVKRGAKRGQVSVRFKSDLDEREYVVSRDTAGAYQVYDPVSNTKIVEQKNQVIPWLEKHIGVEPGTDLSALFKTTIGVPQGTFTYDFTLPAGNRKSVFDQILKVEEYRRASDNLRETLRYLETRITESDKKLAEAEGELKAYDETKREHDEIESRLRSLETELTKVNTERDCAAREVETLNQLFVNIETHRGAIERLTVKLEFTRDSLGVARESAEQARTAAQIVESVRGGYERYMSASARLSELEKQRIAREQLRNQNAAIERDWIEIRSRARLIEERLNEIAAARDELSTLSGKIAEQQSIETRIAELREARGELQGLKHSAETLDRELEKLRSRYASLQKQVETAHSQREKAERTESLEGERARLGTEINRIELALGNYNLRREHFLSLEKDCVRLSEEVERKTNEVSRLEPLIALSSALAEIEARHQNETERLARLRAELARDDEMIRALDEGGICPLLTEKCLNLKPGETLDNRFRSGLKSRRDEIEALEQIVITLAEDLKNSRVAAAESARLPDLKSEIMKVSAELETKQGQLATLNGDGRLVSEEQLLELKQRRVDVERQVQEAHEARVILNQARGLADEVDEVRKEGESKRHEIDRIRRRMAEVGSVESLIAEAENTLRALDDPRGRSAALQRVINRETELLRESEKVELQSTEIKNRLEKVRAELDSFAALDSEMAGANHTRAECERDYHAFIQNEKIAGTFMAREQEVAQIAAEIEQTEKLLAGASEALKELEREYQPERHRAAEARLDESRKRSTHLAAELDHVRDRFVRLQSQLDRLEEVRQRMREQFAAREKAKVLKEAADFIREILQKAAPYITETYLFAISVEANQLFREITGRYDVTLRWTKDYEITLEEEGRERPFSTLSGGEQMAAALSVRMALLKELSDINLAFFDEPTTNMDEERRRNLAQQIGRIKDFHQLFVISHDDSFEGYTDQVITLGAQASSN